MACRHSIHTQKKHEETEEEDKERWDKRRWRRKRGKSERWGERGRNIEMIIYRETAKKRAGPQLLSSKI